MRSTQISIQHKYANIKHKTQGLAINQFEHTPGAEAFLEELGFASPYRDWWSLLVLLGMVLVLRLVLVLGTKFLTFEKR